MSEWYVGVFGTVARVGEEERGGLESGIGAGEAVKVGANAAVVIGGWG